MERGHALLQSIAERIVTRWLQNQGSEVVSAGGEGSRGRGVDLTSTSPDGVRRIKVKPDAYYGIDATKAADRSLALYRGSTGSLALEAVANSVTREPGWGLSSDADDLFYYFVAISQPEDVVAELAAQSDEVLFANLEVERDELLVLPMPATVKWFAQNIDRYAPRPVARAGVSAWYRLVPRADVEAGVKGVRSAGPIFESITG
ncbi:MAG TPA: hypothetical protein VLA05_10835 [Coriobacteriia bacterium]|nr:hypothetical protein [Coriobacteriia bacterium]